jgi:hypothetical protein
MKLYSTTDTAASLRKAYEEFTHVVLQRAYTLPRAVYFNTASLEDMVLSQYASWIPASESQLTKWRDSGGVLLELDETPQKSYPADVTVMVEAPFNMRRLNACNKRNTEYGVIPNPVSWSSHEGAVALRFPDSEVLRRIWGTAKGQPFTLPELAAETDVPVIDLRYLIRSLKPEEYWYVQKRLAPDLGGLKPAWEWLEAGATPRRAVRESGHKRQIDELGRLGYIGLKKCYHFPQEEPDWRKLYDIRQAALTDLANVRTLVESLPDHLAR